MRKRWLFASLGSVALIVAGDAQTLDRRAEMVGAGSPDQGKCTIEVVVDGAVEIQVRGTSATMRNLSGQTPQWRRFQCTGALPANPADFRFAGVDGRGRQQLVDDPRNSGAAVVRIEDPDNGAEGYTFDLIWGNGPGFQGQRGPESNRPSDRDFNQPSERGFDHPGNRGLNRPGGREERDFNRQGNVPKGRFTTDQAIRVCQDSIREEARGRFGSAKIDFRQTNIDNSRGSNDWVVGIIAVNTSRWRRNELYRFSCSVDFETGRVRTAHIGVPNY